MHGPSLIRNRFRILVSFVVSCVMLRKLCYASFVVSSVPYRRFDCCFKSKENIEWQVLSSVPYRRFDCCFLQKKNTKNR